MKDANSFEPKLEIILKLVMIFAIAYLVYLKLNIFYALVLAGVALFAPSFMTALIILLGFTTAFGLNPQMPLAWQGFWWILVVWIVYYKGRN